MGNIKKEYAGEEVSAFFPLWPVYAPYRIYKIETAELIHNPDDRIEEIKGFTVRHRKEYIRYGTGNWVIQGQLEAYRKVWEAEGALVEGVKFINPAEELGLLNTFRKIDIDCHDSILSFVNRYGLLGTGFKESRSWITAQIPEVSFGIESEKLFDFQLAAQTLQETYALRKGGGDKAVLLRKLRHNLAGVTEYPQQDKEGNIIPGKRGQTLLDYIWLHFYNLVLGNGWRECAYCGNLFEKAHGHSKYCTDCKEPGQTPPWIKLQRQQQKGGKNSDANP